MALLLQSGRRVGLQRLHIDLGVAVHVVDGERAPRVARVVLAALVQRVVVEQRHLRVRVEIMGSQKCTIVAKSQSVLIVIHPIISTRTRTTAPRPSE